MKTVEDRKREWDALGKPAQLTAQQIHTGTAKVLRTMIADYSRAVIVLEDKLLGAITDKDRIYFNLRREAATAALATARRQLALWNDACARADAEDARMAS